MWSTGRRPILRSLYVSCVASVGMRGWLTTGRLAMVVLESGPVGVRDGISEPNAPEGNGDSELHGVGNDRASEAVSSGNVDQLVDDRQTGNNDIEGDYTAVGADGSVLRLAPTVSYPTKPVNIWEEWAHPIGVIGADAEDDDG